MVRRIYEAKDLSPKQQCSKVISMLRKYAKQNGHFITVEKFGTDDNNGSLILYFTTNRYDYSTNNSVRFTFQIGYESDYSTDFRTTFLVGWLGDSEGPDFGSRRFNSYEDIYDFILNYITEYGNINN